MGDYSCLLLTYKATGDNGEELTRQYTLDKVYSAQFLLTPIDKINIQYLNNYGYTYGTATAELSEIKPISVDTHHTLKSLHNLEKEDMIIRMLGKQKVWERENKKNNNINRI